MTYFDKAKWKSAGFSTRRYNYVLDKMGADWKNDFKEVLEYWINYAIWAAEDFLKKSRGD